MATEERDEKSRLPSAAPTAAPAPSRAEIAPGQRWGLCPPPPHSRPPTRRPPTCRRGRRDRHSRRRPPPPASSRPPRPCSPREAGFLRRHLRCVRLAPCGACVWPAASSSSPRRRAELRSEGEGRQCRRRVRECRLPPRARLAAPRRMQPLCGPCDGPPASGRDRPAEGRESPRSRASWWLEGFFFLCVPLREKNRPRGGGSECNVPVCSGVGGDLDGEPGGWPWRSQSVARQAFRSRLGLRPR